MDSGGEGGFEGEELAWGLATAGVTTLIDPDLGGLEVAQEVLRMSGAN